MPSASGVIPRPVSRWMPLTALWDGTPLHGAADLRKALVARSPQFAETVAEKLLAYGLGREVGVL